MPQIEQVIADIDSSKANLTSLQRELAEQEKAEARVQRDYDEACRQSALGKSSDPARPQRELLALQAKVRGLRNLVADEQVKITRAKNEKRELENAERERQDAAEDERLTRAFAEADEEVERLKRELRDAEPRRVAAYEARWNFRNRKARQPEQSVAEPVTEAGFFLLAEVSGEKRLAFTCQSCRLQMAWPFGQMEPVDVRHCGVVARFSGDTKALMTRRHEPVRTPEFVKQ